MDEFLNEDEGAALQSIGGGPSSAAAAADDKAAVHTDRSAAPSHSTQHVKQEAPQHDSTARPDKKPQPPPHPPTASQVDAVYIGNLQWWTTDAEVEALCREYGTVTNMKFLEDRSNGRSKGCVLVEFSDASAAAACKDSLNGKEINGRACIVTFVTAGKPPPYMQAGGRDRGGGGPRGGGFGGRGRMDRGGYGMDGPYNDGAFMGDGGMMGMMGMPGMMGMGMAGMMAPDMAFGGMGDMMADMMASEGRRPREVQLDYDGPLEDFHRPRR